MKKSRVRQLKAELEEYARSRSTIGNPMRVNPKALRRAKKLYKTMPRNKREHFSLLAN